MILSASFGKDSIMYDIIGLFNIGSNDFDLVYVNGLSLVPKPPASIIASKVSSTPNLFVF